jgi:hypothetical protein
MKDLCVEVDLVEDTRPETAMSARRQEQLTRITACMNESRTVAALEADGDGHATVEKEASVAEASGQHGENASSRPGPRPMRCGWTGGPFYV